MFIRCARSHSSISCTASCRRNSDADSSSQAPPNSCCCPKRSAAGPSRHISWHRIASHHIASLPVSTRHSNCTVHIACPPAPLSSATAHTAFLWPVRPPVRPPASTLPARISAATHSTPLQSLTDSDYYCITVYFTHSHSACFPEVERSRLFATEHSVHTTHTFTHSLTHSLCSFCLENCCSIARHMM